MLDNLTLDNFSNEVCEMEVKGTIFQFEKEAWCMALCLYEQLILLGLDVVKLEAIIISKHNKRTLLDVKHGNFGKVQQVNVGF